MKCVDFIDNALFKGYGNICCSSQPSSLCDKLSVYKSDSDSFFSTTIVYIFSHTPPIQVREQQPSKISYKISSEILEFPITFQLIVNLSIFQQWSMRFQACCESLTSWLHIDFKLMSLYRSCGCGRGYVFFTCIMHDLSTCIMHDVSVCIIILAHKLCILYIFTILFIGYGKNRACHRSPVHAIETRQRSTCCQIDVALLLIVPVQWPFCMLLHYSPILNFFT